MTTKIRIINIEGNKDVVVSVITDNGATISNENTVLDTGESVDFYVFDSQELHVKETGEFK